MRKRRPLIGLDKYKGYLHQKEREGKSWKGKETDGRWEAFMRNWLPDTWKKRD